MAKYAKLDGGATGTVVQIQPYSGTGFVSCPDNVVCGYNYDGTDWTAPLPPDKTWTQIREKQRNLIVIHQDLIEIYEREVAHIATSAPYSNGMDESKYQEWLTYFQTIRASDEATYPGDPNAAWANLDVLATVSSQPVTTGYNT